MNLPYKKTHGQFTKVLGIEKDPSMLEKFPNNPVNLFVERPIEQDVAVC